MSDCILGKNEFEIVKIIIAGSLTLWAILIASVTFLINARNTAEKLGIEEKIFKSS